MVFKYSSLPVDHESNRSDEDSVTSETPRIQNAVGKTESMQLEMVGSGSFSMYPESEKFEHPMSAYIKESSTPNETDEPSIKKTGVEFHESIASDKSDKLSEITEPISEDEPKNEMTITSQLGSSVILQKSSEDITEFTDELPEMVSTEHIIDENDKKVAIDEEERKAMGTETVTEPRITSSDEEFDEVSPVVNEKDQDGKTKEK